MITQTKKITINWSSNLAYAIGLITTDGCLSKDRRHIIFVSKDLQLIKTFQKCLKIRKKIGIKASGFNPSKKYFFVQFSNVCFYNFLISIGLTPAKSKKLGSLKIPNRYFFDFLRGHFDGDGTFYGYWDKRWKNSFMFYTRFVSASEEHILWINNKLIKLLDIKGSFNKDKISKMCQLKYAKKDSMAIVSKMYYRKGLPCLKRKYNKIINVLSINKSGRGATG